VAGSSRQDGCWRDRGAAREVEEVVGRLPGNGEEGLLALGTRNEDGIGLSGCGCIPEMGTPCGAPPSSGLEPY
jgi:hypothetical protein